MVTPTTPRAGPPRFRVSLWNGGTAVAKDAVLSREGRRATGHRVRWLATERHCSASPETGRPMPAGCESLPFCSSDAFSRGVEEGVLLASAWSLRPYGGTDAVLALLDPTVGRFTGEVGDGVLEVATPVHGRVAEAIGVL